MTIPLIIGVTIGASFLALILFFLIFFVWSAKSTLLKGQATWSAKKLPIKRSKSILQETNNSSLLRKISDQTSEYLGSNEKIDQ
tara:strand:- start:5416 stop:5667 length:252 start_codon:yes stop_codon:yes gene_type:complete